MALTNAELAELLARQAHHPWQLEFIHLGLAGTMRAKILADRIVNFMTAQALKTWVAHVRDRSRKR